jgi:UDP-GlcNAc:undecaprenyl-phosphate GlcNAc-1-phosphate transferase
MNAAAIAGMLALLAVVSGGIVRVMIRVGTLDLPGERSSHTRPTPKGGGVGIAAAFLMGLTVLYFVGGRTRVPDLPFAGLLAASLGIAVVSYADDVRSWPFTIKLAAQLAAALAAIACGIRLHVLHLPWIGAVDTGWLGVPLTAGWIVFATNAVNFIDGLNGLASGTVGIACLFLAGVAASQGGWFVELAALVLAAGIAGFLPFNYPRARIFMGDVGSQFCGFIIAVLGVLAADLSTRTLSVLLVPLLLLGVLFDVAFTLARRWVAGDRITQAHRSHLYQVAHRAGWPDWLVTLVYWAMAVWGGICGVGFAGEGVRPALLGCAILPELAWLAVVLASARRAGITRW